MLSVTVYMATTEILEDVITNFGNQGALPRPPAQLYHYTSLEVIQKILEFDGVRLSHAEYSNDQREMIEARAVIETQLLNYPGTRAFRDDVARAFASQVSDIDAYIFCMTAGLAGSTSPQDMLSQWRAYAQDGRGGAIALEMNGLAALVYHMPGLRINPVIYERSIQEQMVDSIIAKGDGMHQQGNASAVDATVAALIFLVPLMKAGGFAEEKEWRLIFMPVEEGPKATLGFTPRRDFLAPFVSLRDLWDNLRPALSNLPSQRRIAPVNVPLPTGHPLIPIHSLMVGPSGHQSLNVRAVNKAVDQWRPSLLGKVDQSGIPYRSIS